MADRLFDLLPPLDVGDPASFLAATAATFADYPAEVMERAVPEIARRSDRPTLKLIFAVCEEIYAPIARQLERDRAAQSHRLGLPPPSTKRTPEQQARVDAQVAAARAQLHIPEGGVFKTVTLPPSADQPYTAPVYAERRDGRHAQRVMAELELRKARRDSSTDPPKESSAA